MLLTDEDPANIVCLNHVVAGNAGAGLDNCVCTWNHDEYAYQKLKHLLPERSAWLLRYHSLHLGQVEPYLNHSDREKVKQWLRPFMKHDKESKSVYNFPQLDWRKHRRPSRVLFTWKASLKIAIPYFEKQGQRGHNVYRDMLVAWQYSYDRSETTLPVCFTGR